MNKLDTKRILIFLAFAFGIAWLFGLIVFLTGGLKNSPVVIPGFINLSTILLAVGYMSAPALAHILTRLVTREGWRGLFLRPHFKKSWSFWLVAWFAPAGLTILGAVVYFLFFPGRFDPSLASTQASLAEAGRKLGQELPLSPWAVAIINSAIGIIVAPLINGLFTFGEEFGWRAYLLKKLLPWGARRGILAGGVIWGVWHWPIIIMGHNYGVFTNDYPLAPWSGMAAMVVFTVGVGTFLSWAALRGKSVWPAVIGHAAVNGVAGLALLVTRGEPNLVLGPMPVGIIAVIPWLATAVVILLNPQKLTRLTEDAADASPAAVTHAPKKPRVKIIQP